MIRRYATVTAVLLALFAMTRSAGAQAWVPPAGTGTVTVASQRIDHTGHRLTDGTLIDNGTSVNVSLYVGVDYALTDRWAFSAALPYVFGRYSDPSPPPPFVPFLPLDQCRCWNSGPQDFDVSVRYNVANGAFALTPSISFGVPSHDYAYRGEAAVGRHLKELRLTVNAGQRLDAITPKLFVEGRYTYAIVEQVIDVPNNRSTTEVSASYRVATKAAVSGLATWQRTHGGLRTGSLPPADLVVPGDVNTVERLAQHDRLLRDNSLHLGVTGTYQLSRFDVFASYVAFVNGTDTHAGRAISTGINWPFEFH